jgi:serine phosphatase RsbU (regulator of sigma subunit)
MEEYRPQTGSRGQRLDEPKHGRSKGLRSEAEREARRPAPGREEAGLVAIIFRLAFLLAFLLVSQLAVARIIFTLSPQAYYVVIGAAVYCFAVLLVYAFRGDIGWLRPVTVVVDLGLVTLLIVSAPAVRPGFFPIYYLLVVMGALELGLWGGIAAGLVASLFCATGLWLHARAGFGHMDEAWATASTQVPWIMLVAFASGLMSRAHRRAVEAEEELISARRLQQMLFPRTLPPTPGYDVGRAFELASQVGGDYFDILAAGPGRVGVCIADISGRGVPAALDISLLKHAVHAAVTTMHEPSAVASHVNRMMYPHFESLSFERFVSLFFGVLELATGHLRYVNCGHTPPILLRAAGEVRELFTGGIVLGALRAPDYAAHEVTLQPGDVLGLCTDGVTSARNRAGEEFGSDRMAAVMHLQHPEPAQTVAEAILDAVAEFAVHSDDDISALVIKRVPA